MACNKKLATGVVLGTVAGAVTAISAGAIATQFILGKGVYIRDHKVRPAKKNTAAPAPQEKTPQQLLREEASHWYHSLEEQKLTINNREGMPIYARIIPAAEKSDLWVICIHGYTSDPAGMSPYAIEFHKMGFNVMLPTMRAHFDSEHKYIGMGWLDRFDIIDRIFWIIENYPDAKIVLHGVSMGGATVMMTTGENLPANVKCAVEDCGYSSVWNEFSDVIRSRGVPPVPLLSLINAVGKHIVGYDFKEASSVNQLKKSKIPTLFIHGEEDKFVPYYMLDVNYNAAVCEKERVSVPDAVHANSHLVNPELYWSSVKSFVEKYVDLP